MADKKEVISFRSTIPAGETLDFTERVKADGTIEKLTVRFYQGQQKALEVVPRVIHKGEKIEDMLSYPTGTDGYLSGENDYFVYDVVIPVAYDDVIQIRAINTDATYDYSLACDVTIDYYAGKNRVIGGVV